MDRKTKTLRDRVLEHLAVLRIPITAEELDHVVEAAEREGLALLDSLDRLFGEQAARRRDRGIKRRITAAHFAEHKTLDTFDWKFNRTINRPQYEQLATGDFIRRRSNVLLVGQSGVGKSHLMQAIGLSACALGYRVLYTTSAEMILKLTAALADKSLRETLKRYASWDVLVVDEFGFDRIERDECPQAAHLLYKVITGRHLKRSTILITNIDFDAWGAVPRRRAPGDGHARPPGRERRGDQDKGAVLPRQTAHRRLPVGPPSAFTCPTGNRQPGPLPAAGMDQPAAGGDSPVGSPAHAGIAPAACRSRSRSRRLPRARGDRPPTTVLSTLE